MTKDFTTREALIPMVGGVQGGMLARIAADDELAAPHSAQLDRCLSELLEYGLYQAGQQAKAAVRVLKLPGRAWRGRGAAALHVVNPGDVVGLGAENAVSAELGLALALLMFQAQTSERAVIATGALELSTGSREVPVLPIHHLARKLRLVAQHFNQPGSAAAPRFFFVPKLDPDGAAVLERYRADAHILQALGIELRGVSTLAEAAQLVDAQRYAVRSLERRARWILGAAAAGGAVALAVHLWLSLPIALNFAPVANADGSVIVTPARSRQQPSGSVLLVPCQLRGSSLPGFPIGDRVAVRLHTGSASDHADWFGGYRHVLVAVTASGGPKVLSPPTLVPVAPGAAPGYLLDVREPEEDILLAWLVKRGAPFDAAALDASLRKSLLPLPPAERISAARNILSARAAGVLFYYFRSVSPDGCT